MKRIIYSFSITSILIISVIVLSGCYSSSPTTARGGYSGPDWAPYYESGVRYYYIPDIETYYDVSARNFIYFDRGQWITSGYLPSPYQGYDLYNGYAVVLDRRVYEPWRYHQNYVSSYPRYYYQSKYHNDGNRRVRGYNENARRPVYSNSSSRSTRSETTTSPSRDVNANSTRTQQSTEYNNRRTGRPVRVSPEMRQPAQSSSSNTSSRRQSSSSTTNSQSGTESKKDQPQRRSSSTSTPSTRSSTESQQQRNRTAPSENSSRSQSSSRSNENNSQEVQSQRRATSTQSSSERGNSESQSQERSTRTRDRRN